MELDGREISSLNVREECGLRMFENRVLREISGPTKDKVARRREKIA
jgi:hypothetical protein